MKYNYEIQLPYFDPEPYPAGVNMSIEKGCGNISLMYERKLNLILAKYFVIH